MEYSFALARENSLAIHTNWVYDVHTLAHAFAFWLYAFMTLCLVAFMPRCLSLQKVI
jgi:hypothetical protein